MVGDREEAEWARRSRPVAAARTTCAPCAVTMDAVSRAVFVTAAFSVTTLVLVAVFVLRAAGPAGATHLPQLPVPTTTVPVVSAPALTAPTVTDTPVTVPAAPVPKITVPSVPVTLTAPKLDLPVPAPSGRTGGEAAAPVPAGAGPGPTTAVGSTASPVPVSTVAPAGTRRAENGGSRIGTSAGHADPTSPSLALRLRRAAAETVQQLTFPMGLMLAMLAFVVFQHRVDKNDPRLAAPADSGDEDLLGFS